jgi:hypothetical protein
MLVRAQNVGLNLHHLVSCNIDGAPVVFGHAGSRADTFLSQTISLCLSTPSLSSPLDLYTDREAGASETER